MDKNENIPSLESLVARLKELGESIYYDGASEEEIALFEETNKFDLPKKYKEWLSFSDGGDLILPAGVQLYGVKHMPLIDINEEDRPDDSYVVIGALSTGDPILFKKGEEQISIYNHDDGVIEDDESYDNFFAFLDDLANIVGLDVN